MTRVPGRADDSPVSVVVVDDEPAARRGLVRLVGREVGFEVVAECTDGRQLLDTLARHDPDLVFLDIQMPGMDAFETLRRVSKSELPLVIFVTAYDHYAVRAFEAHAVDYLLKPVDGERFHRACEHVRTVLRRRGAEEYTWGLLRVIETLAQRLEDHGRTAESEVAENDPDPDQPAQFVSRTHQRLRLIDPDDVLWVSAAGDYVRLHTAEATHLIRETMKDVGARLHSDRFVRVHRSTLVRLDAVREFRLQSSGKLEVVLPGGEARSVSRRGRERLREALGFDL